MAEAERIYRSTDSSWTRGGRSSILPSISRRFPLMSAISLRFCRPDAPTLSVYDHGGNGLPVIFQHGLCGDVHPTIKAFPTDPRVRPITLESLLHGTSITPDPPLSSL